MEKFKFIDLFCGLGGFRIALENLGGECVFSSEINEHACLIYQHNFGELPSGDITTIDTKNIPNFDVLCAGFPCQAFSIAGKKLGFEDTRGTLFFEICRIIKEKQPKVVLLENVKNLTLHDKGRTFKTIVSSLEELGYLVSYKILNAKDFGVPQNRERIIIAATKTKKLNFEQLITINNPAKIEDILDNNKDYLDKFSYTLLEKKHVKKNKQSGLIFAGFLNKTMRNNVDPSKFYFSRNHRQPNRIYRWDGTHPTLSSQESAGRYYVLLKNGKVRKLTINECYKLMGFPKNFKLIGSKNNLFQRIGNSVCIPMISAVGELIKNEILIDY
jgi:DNA (cytosine-5)-methyltransferase 1